MSWKEGIYLVRPNVGEPLLMAPDSLSSFQITVAGKSDAVPTARQLENFLRQDPPVILRNLKPSSDDVVISVIKVHDPYTKYPKFEANYSRGRIPVLSTDHQYDAGFRWEYPVSIGIRNEHINSLKRSAAFPLLLNLKFRSRINYHALYVDERLVEDMSNQRFTIIHVTDLHVARRNDRIPEILSRVRTAEESRKLSEKYNNFNDNLRSVIKYANQKIENGEMVIVVATGDLVEYYHDGYIGEEFIWKKGKAKMSHSNVRKLVEIITGSDGKYEGLKCPVFTIPGNHDYLVHEVPVCTDAKLGGTDFALPISLGRRNSSYQFNLLDNEGIEYDIWNMKNRFVGARKVQKEILHDIYSYKEEHGTLPVMADYNRIFPWARYGVLPYRPRLDQDHTYWLIKPHHKHMRCYLEDINYDTDFQFRVGEHQFLCLNTAQDLIPSVGKILYLKKGIGSSRNITDVDRDYVNDGPHNAGINGDHIKLVDKAFKNPDFRGLVFILTHAPLVCFHNHKTEGMEVLYEDFHEQNTPPNAASKWLEDLYDKSPRDIQTEGFPLKGTKYFKRGSRDPYINFSCADGKYLNLFRVIAPPLGVKGDKPVIILSGHTHYTHEFRLEGPKSRQEIANSTFYYYVDNYSGRWLYSKTTNLNRRKNWIIQHSPLLLTSGALKNKNPEFREITVKDGTVEKMRVNHEKLERLNTSRWDPGCRKIAIRSSNGQYVCAERGGGHELVANRSRAGEWETFELIRLGREVALRAHNGKYVRAKGGGGGRLAADRSEIKGHEIFGLIELEEGQVALWTHDGKFVRAEGGGGKKIKADRSFVRNYETFRLVELGNKKVGLRAFSGHYVCAEGGGGQDLVVNRTKLGEWETFEVIDRGELIALRTHNGQYMRAKEGGGREVKADKWWIRTHESFSMIKRGGNKVAFRAHKGEYLGAKAGGKHRIMAESNEIGQRETFEMAEL